MSIVSLAQKYQCDKIGPIRFDLAHYLEGDWYLQQMTMPEGETLSQVCVTSKYTFKPDLWSFDVVNKFGNLNESWPNRYMNEIAGQCDEWGQFPVFWSNGEGLLTAMATRIIAADTSLYFISYWCDAYSGFNCAWVYSREPKMSGATQDVVDYYLSLHLPSLDKTQL